MFVLSAKLPRSDQLGSYPGWLLDLQCIGLHSPRHNILTVLPDVRGFTLKATGVRP